ncbi:hypothetical protein GZH47_13400 [Paenibacillus rhizovicinus]|uniref:Activator of Hsp90 ATPase homologue 1/2-like C-terminal domain-containing protein n=1 Tax=Paenibacillus rhizovicinus TaxID=2704463 RepID=A0A6C0NZR4_9BACL|nr:SRPBCC family protein [Paenibacillus rhizovicinus]QHW31735.1 hypothetical protein GZH47_13400 [Paenibacillus rhizovicinus]
MNNVTSMKILQPAAEVFEAFVDPARIGNFWFSSSSERWEAGKTIGLRYDEYNAQLEIHVLEVETNRTIVFRWGGEDNVVTMQFRAVDPAATIIDVTETGFREDDPELLAKMVDNKEGWVFMLTCLKGYLEFGVSRLRGGLVKG